MAESHNAPSALIRSSGAVLLAIAQLVHGNAHLGVTALPLELGEIKDQ